jgi:hypothetical protein
MGSDVSFLGKLTYKYTNLVKFASSHPEFGFKETMMGPIGRSPLEEMGRGLVSRKVEGSGKVGIQAEPPKAWGGQRGVHFTDAELLLSLPDRALPAQGQSSPAERLPRVCVVAFGCFVIVLTFTEWGL